MKTLPLVLVLFCAAGLLRGQETFSQDEALKQIYSQYDAQKKTAHWVCTMDSETYIWPCVKDYANVSISVELTSEVVESGVKMVYLVASAKPTGDSIGGLFQCHLCRPAIGVGVFAWQSHRWVLQCANAAVGAFSGYGDPGGVELVRIGPEKHGVLLSASDLTHGRYVSFKVLLAPLGNSVADVWSVAVEQNNGVDVEEYDAKAAFKFFAANDASSKDYYEIEVVSKGNSKNKPENWTEIYRFEDGKYKLLSHQDSVEAK